MLRRRYLSKGTEPTGLAGEEAGQNQNFQDVAPPGGVLVGLRLVKGVSWGGAIRSLQPIYQVGNQYVLGQVHGPAQGVDQIQYLAKPGYVIGTVRLRVGLAMNAMQIEFHAMDRNGNVEDRYTTKGFGCAGGAAYKIDYGPFVGMDGSIAQEPCGLQFVRAITPGNSYNPEN